MDAGGINAAGIANAVWTNVTRPVLSIGGAFTVVAVQGGSLGAGLILDVRPGAGAFRMIVVHTTGTAQAAAQGSYDGTTFTTVVPVGSDANNVILCFNVSTLGNCVKNTAASAQSYYYTGWDIR